MTANRARVGLAFLALYVLWGSTFLAMRHVVRGGFPPFLATGTRMLLAGALILGWERARGRRLAPGARWPDLAISGALLFVGGNALSMIASQTVASGLVALLSATLPLWIALGAARTGGERPSGLAIAGLAVGFCGIAVVVGPGLAGGSALGIAAAAVSPIAWAAGALWTRHRLSGVPATTIAGHQMVLGAIAAIAVGLARGELGALEPAAGAGLALGYLVVFGNLLGYTSFVFLMARVPAAKVATYAYVNPVIALGLGWWLAGERPPPAALAGAAIVVAGVVLVTRAQVARAPRPPLGTRFERWT